MNNVEQRVIKEIGIIAFLGKKNINNLKLVVTCKTFKFLINYQSNSERSKIELYIIF